ncbi:MAG: HepT-like ribonuclease domain-containing protein [Thermoguttaceae bacterium]
MKRSKDRVILEKMLGYAKDSRKYNESIDLDDFLNDERTIVFTVFSLSQLGELVSRLSDACMEESPHVPWAKIKSLRNRIVHEYEGITYKTVWQIVQNDIPKLIDDLTKLLSLTT